MELLLFAVNIGKMLISVMKKRDKLLLSGSCRRRKNNLTFLQERFLLFFLPQKEKYRKFLQKLLIHAETYSPSKENKIVMGTFNRKVERLFLNNVAFGIEETLSFRLNSTGKAVLLQWRTRRHFFVPISDSMSIFTSTIHFAKEWFFLSHFFGSLSVLSKTIFCPSLRSCDVIIRRLKDRFISELF